MVLLNMEDSGLQTVVIDNLYIEAMLDGIDENETCQFKIILLNNFIVCIGFTTEIGESVPESYVFWLFVRLDAK